MDEGKSSSEGIEIRDMNNSCSFPKTCYDNSSCCDLYEKFVVLTANVVQNVSIVIVIYIFSR